MIFSLEALKKASPRFCASTTRTWCRAEKTGDHQVTFRFDVKGNRELPMIIGELPILPKHYWEGTGANGEPRDLAKSTLEVPLGSGPYRIKEVDAGPHASPTSASRTGGPRTCPCPRASGTSTRSSIVYFRDRDAAFEAFKAGKLDFWRGAAPRTGRPASTSTRSSAGLVKRQKLPIARVAPMQAFAFNIRRPQFQDPRVRRAFNLALDFEWANKNLFYDQYVRVGSYFDNSELKATGLPQGRELEILNEVEPRCRPRCSPPNGRTPSTPRPRMRASTLARRPSCWPRPAGSPRAAC